MSEVLLRVRLTPKGGQSALIKQEGEVLFARVAEPPVNGAANRALIVLLAKSLNIPKSRIDFHAGETSRDKVLKIEGISPQELQERVQNALRTR